MIQKMMTTALIFCFAVVSSSANAVIKIAITVDDLPIHGMTPKSLSRTQIADQILKTFKKHSIPEAYGFINGVHLESSAFKTEGRAILEMWRLAGYPLANHSYSHASLLRNSTVESFKIEILKNESLLDQLSNGSFWKFFRYPFLHEGESLKKRNEIRQFLSDKGYQIAQVTVDFEDWAWNSAYTRCAAKKDQNNMDWLHTSYMTRAEQALLDSESVNTALFHKEFPQILLLHIGAFTSLALDTLLTKYKNLGVEFITLAEAMKDPAYAFDPGVTFPEGALFQDQVMKAKGITHEKLGIKRVPVYNFNKKLAGICLK